MEITINSQVQMFIYSLAAGVLMGAVYDIFRILRLAVKHFFAAILAEDIIFSAFCACFAFYFFLELNQGNFRLVYFIGFFLGGLIYYCTMGTVVIALSEKIILLIRKILHLLTLPLIKLFNLLKKWYHPIKKQFEIKRKNLNSSSRVLYNKIVCKKPKKGRKQSEKKQRKESFFS